jgi:hypothetical protein
MARWEARANGRKAGALGVMHVLPVITFEYDGAGLPYLEYKEGAKEAARKAYYDAGYEHITIVTIVKITD